MSTKNDAGVLSPTQPVKRLSLRRETVQTMSVHSGLKTGERLVPDKSTGVHGPYSACMDCTATIN